MRSQFYLFRGSGLKSQTSDLPKRFGECSNVYHNLKLQNEHADWHEIYNTSLQSLREALPAIILRIRKASLISSFFG